MGWALRPQPSFWGRILDNKIKQLTGLRGAAAGMVLIGHMPGGLVIPSLPGLPNAGVAIFFALSSFLLTYLAMRERERTGAFHVPGFIWRRMVRVWPLYLAGVLVAAVVFPGWFAAEAKWVLPFASNWSLALYDFAGHRSGQPTAVAILWSVSVEEQFYLVLPIILPALLTLRKRALLVSIAALILSGALLRLIFWLSTTNIAPPVSAGGIYYATFSYIDVFAMGGTAGAVYFLRQSNPVCASLCAILKPWHAIVALCLSLNPWAASIWAPYTMTTVVMFGVVGLSCAALVLAVAASPDSITGQSLRLPPLQWLGVISFSFYVWHIYATTLGTAYFHSNGAATFAMALAFGAVSYFVIERPTARLRDRSTLIFSTRKILPETA